ncbi:oligopeptide transporter 6 [Vanrija albida]|uniref:Oligopeptide transporter 6 n=1 Tax=Vanrija albida TaxID=181172 RepID=A0ABR3Q016_9TREE
MFSVANGPGATYYVYLVQLLPQYLNQTWVSYGYEILLALSTQFFGFGFAGLLRRFVIYPPSALWPQVLPTLALNRVLVRKEKQGEVIHGWKVTRYKFFLVCFGLMFCYFWIPNFLFQALRSFNWMTWIAPQNFNLGMITGFYGGMGYNPVATFDWNVSGTGALVTPFFSQAQQYLARILSGLIIIGMYYGNYAWASYTPINSAEAFANNGKVYNVTKVMGDQGKIDVEKYKVYGPPYFSGANVFGQGAWFAWYPMTLFYYSIRHWNSLTRGFQELWWTIKARGSRSTYEGQEDDAQTRLMKEYPEVPEWWFLIILLVSFAFGVAAVAAFPTYTPWWSILTVIGMSAVFLIPSTIMRAVANVGMGFNVLFQLLAGVWWAGNPLAQIIVTAFGETFNAQADNFVSDLKLAHYAKLPPRAVFRAQITAVLINCFIFVSLLNWMVTSFNDGTLCTWGNKAHFVCTNAVLTYASAVVYGAFGVKNMFKLYPILPWTFLMGAVVGIGVAVAQKWGPQITAWTQKRVPAAVHNALDKVIYRPIAMLHWFDPPVFWSGALHWTNGSNLSYATNGLYISFIFMYYIKRRYSAWWEKYNYILEAGLDVGVAVSGIIMTLVFSFAVRNVSINWWGNRVATAGVDFQSYNQNASLLPIPESGYFGLSPSEFPMNW